MKTSSIKTTKNTTTKSNTNPTWKTQKEAVMHYLRKNRKRMTAEEICKGINSTYNTNLTIPQVSQCLSRFSGTIVNKYENGLTSKGRKVSRWSYIAPSKS